MRLGTGHPGVIPARELADALRNQITTGGLYRINVGHPDDVDRSGMSQIWEREGLISISSWGLDIESVFDDTEAGTVEEYKFKDSMLRDIHEGIDWDSVQDHFAHNSGLARGVHQTFYEDLNDGTAVLANMSKGTAVGTVRGPVRYDTEAPTCEPDDANHHTFTRSVRWARDRGGDVLTIDTSTLPSSLHPLPRTLTQVNDLQELMDLSQLIGFLAEEGSRTE